MRLLLLIAIISGTTLMWATTTFGCGFHDPKQIASGILNRIYPRALHVRTAVWQAEHAGVLAPREKSAPKDLFAYQRTVARLQEFADRLSVRGSAPGGTIEFSMVLIDSMMWARFQRHGDSPGLKVVAHVPGPEPGDVVLVSHSKVVSELAMQTLTAKDARTHGLIRYYGPDGGITFLRHVLETSLSDRRTVPATTN